MHRSSRLAPIDGFIPDSFSKRQIRHILPCGTSLPRTAHMASTWLPVTSEARRCYEYAGALEQVTGSTLRDNSNMSNQNWVLHRPSECLGGQVGISRGRNWDDRSTIERIIAAYGRACNTVYAEGQSPWNQEIHNLKLPIHNALLEESVEVVADIFRHPSRNYLFYGFDNTCKSNEANFAAEWWQNWLKSIAYDKLVCLAEFLAISRVANPEVYYLGYPEPENCETILLGLEEYFGTKLSFPNPFANEIGLLTSRGVASDRALYALYQIARMKATAAHDMRVVEIGAGLGRSAYYAYAAGINDYTIIDLPITNAVQSYFLASTLGEDKIALFGEEAQPNKILIYPPTSFLDSSNTYDLAVNVDSITEMPMEIAKAYIKEISARASIFLSINHEFNNFTARELIIQSSPKRMTRNLSWLRRGYIDEVATYT
jgi:hypothetical protein